MDIRLILLIFKIILWMVIIIYQYYVIIKHHNVFIMQFIFDQKSTWNSKIDRARLILGISMLIITVVFGIMFITQNPENNLLNYGNALLFIVFMILPTWFLYFLYSKEREKELINKTKKKIDLVEKNKVSFKIEYTKEQISDIFNKLSENNLIELIDLKQGLLDKELFVKILSVGEIPEKPLFKLNMNYLQIYYFHKKLSKNERKFTLKVFCEIFHNKDGIIIPGNLTSSVSNTKRTQIDYIKPEKKEEIDLIFDFE